MPTEQFTNAAQTTLAAAVDAAVTTLTVTPSPGRPFPAGPNFRVRVDDEILLVTGVAGTTWTVTRAAEGPGAAAAHAAGALVTQVLTAAGLTALGTVTGSTPTSLSAGVVYSTGAVVASGNLSGAVTTTGGSLATTLAANAVTTPAIAAGAVTEAKLTLADVTTNNVSLAAHGFAPKAPADATKFLSGAATPAFAAVKDSDLAVSDVTTNNVTSAAHGFAPKAPADATQYLNGLGAWATPAVVPTGTIAPFAGLTVPSGWLECDGSAVSRTTYASLFGTLSVTRTGTTTSGSPTVTGLATTADLAVGFQVTGTGIPAGATVTAVPSGTSVTLSANATANGSPSLVFTAWGRGDGSTTFNLPDLRRRTVVGAGGTGTGTLGNVLGNTGGAESHVLSTAELPAHSHGTYSGFATGSAFGFNVSNIYASNTNGFSATQNAGGGGAHNNMQPSAVVKWIIKT